MGKRKSYLIKGEFFRTQKELQDRVQKILNGYEIGETLDPIDFQFIYDVLEMHPRASDKIRMGVKSIRVGVEPKFNKTRCFILIRIDGSSSDFSYKKCLSPTDSGLSLFKKAARVAVEPQILEFKNNAFKSSSDGHNCITCPIKGVKVANHEAHVDHEPPNTFDCIVIAFMDEFKINPEEIEYGGFGDHEYEKRFCDKELETKFSKYHQEKAKLRITSAPGNLGQKKKYL